MGATVPPVLFMRIHKTGSESLANQIRSRLPANAACPPQFEWKIRILPLKALRKYRFFQGHICPGTLSLVLPELRVITMLRSPRTRLLSCYFYWKQGAQHAEGEFFEAMRPLSVLEFLRSKEPIIRRATWNVQARLLAGGQFGAIDQQRQNVFGPWLAQSELATEAIRALERFAFVGAAELYELSLRRTFALLDLGPPPPPVWLNVTESKPDSYAPLLADPDIATALADLTAVDQVVYDAVIARLTAPRA